MITVKLPGTYKLPPDDPAPQWPPRVWVGYEINTDTFWLYGPGGALELPQEYTRAMNEITKPEDFSRLAEILGLKEPAR